MSTLTNLGTGSDKLILSISQDYYLGNALFTISIDGVQIGDIQTAEALHGQDIQYFQINGSFLNAHTVSVNFLNDAWGNTASQDRNLYVEGASVDGFSIANASLTELSAGSQSFNFVSTGYTTPVTDIGTGSDNLQLVFSEDAYHGDATFTVKVDGVLLATETLSALHDKAKQIFNLNGTFSAGAHDVEINFLNDAWGYYALADRNLYLESASFNGATISSGHLTELSSGVQSFSFSSTGVPLSDTITLTMAEDAYQGDANFTMTVDGQQSGGIFTVTADNRTATQDVVLKGNYGSGPHVVQVTFLNDQYGGGPQADRNLYVKQVTYDGITTRTETPLLSTGDVGTFTVSATPPAAHIASGLALLGVNLSGAETGPATGVENVDYTYPNLGEINYWAAQGMNIVRIPVLWERLQPQQGGDLDSAQLAKLDLLVSQAAANGMKVDLDLHNYGYGYGNLVGSTGTPDSSLADFWSKMATHFSGNSNVVFGLMNEPHVQSAQDWAQAAQASVTAIRATGATQEILVSGTDWDNGYNWTQDGNATIVAANVTDPLHKMAFEIHQYFDNNTGTSTNVESLTAGPDRLADVTAWAQNTGNKLFLGEFGSGQDASSLTALTNTLDYLKAHSDVWQGGTYWAGGPNMSNYIFNPDPQHGVTSQQASVLSHYTP